MTVDKDFAEKLASALRDAAGVYETRLLGGPRKKQASRGPKGLMLRSLSLAQEKGFQIKKGTKDLPGRAGRLMDRPPSLNRDKLSALLEGDLLQTNLTLQEFVLLDLLLRDAGQSAGLSGLLRPATWSDRIGEIGEVEFFVGSQARTFGENPSELVFAHDLRAVTAIHRELAESNRLSSNIVYAFQPGASHSKRKQPALNLDAPGPPAILVGSPATNPTTEAVLAAVFDRPPWAPQAQGRLPFKFAWPAAMGVNSTFSDVEASQGLASNRRKFFFGEQPYEFGWDDSIAHGVVVLARRARAVVAVIGTTAVATYACAQMASAINHDFPNDRRVVIAHVLAHVDRDTSLPGPDQRSLRKANVATVKSWCLEKNDWVE